MHECGLKDINDSEVTYNNRLALFYTQNMDCKKDAAPRLPKARKRNLDFGVPVLSMNITIPSHGHKHQDRFAFLLSAIHIILIATVCH